MGARVLVTIPLGRNAAVTPGASLMVHDDAVCWNGSTAIGRLIEATGSEDGTALLAVVDLFDGVDELPDASLDGLNVDGVIL